MCLFAELNAEVCKAGYIGVTNSSAKIAKLNVSDAAAHVKPADINVEYAARGTLSLAFETKESQ